MKYISNQIVEQKRFSGRGVGNSSVGMSVLNTLLTPRSKMRYKQDSLNIATHPSLETPFIDHTGRYCLSELLPYNISKRTGAGLKTALKEYEMLLIAASEAIKTLKEGDFKKFDPLVGENACEIRAIWLPIIVANKQIDTNALLTEFCNIQKRINALLGERALSLLMMSGVSLKELFSKENLSVFLNLEELFIIESFLLTEAREVLPNQNGTISLCIREKCNPKKIKHFGDISSNFADNLLSKLRKLIAAASVQFIRQIASKGKNENLINMLSDKFTILHNNHLLCTPMFWTYKSVLSALQYEGIPLVIYAEFLKKETDGYRVIDSAWLFFEPRFNADGTPILVPKQPQEIDYDKIACVVQGAVLSCENKPVPKSQWMKMMLEFPISTIILAGAADHRQYPNVEHDEKIQLLQDHEYEFYKSFAKSNGFSLNNPQTFFIRHVYPSCVGTICSLKRQEEKSTVLI